MPTINDLNPEYNLEAIPKAVVIESPNGLDKNVKQIFDVVAKPCLNNVGEPISFIIPS